MSNWTPEETAKYGWYDESDSRRWVASNLKDLLVRHSLGLLQDASCA